MILKIQSRVCTVGFTAAAPVNGLWGARLDASDEMYFIDLPITT